MRKDVKLGFAIGGVLLAVLIVYVLVVPGGPDQRGKLSSAQQPAGKATGQKDGGGAGAGVKLEPVVPLPVAPPATFTPDGGAGDASKPTVAKADQPKAETKPAEVASAQPKTDPFAADPVPAKRSGLDWSKLLNDQTALMTETPVAVPGAKSPANVPAVPAVATSGNPSDPAVDITKPGPAGAPTSELPEVATKKDETTTAADPAKTQATPAPVPPEAPVAKNDVTAPTTPSVPEGATPTQSGGASSESASSGSTSAATGAGNTHTVQAGETLSSISIQVYGNANFYPAIMRANPNVDPTKLRPGMKINLPALSDVKPAGVASAAAPSDPAGGATIGSHKVEPQIDPAKEYRVQSGDSLYSIAKKLYGQGTKGSKIYEANKAAIGEDEHRLKVGQVLVLPEPPKSR